MTNLALQASVPWRCTCSSAITACEYGTDGNTNPSEFGAWASNGQSEGAWDRVNFLETVLITHAILWQPCHESEQSKTVTFSFSDSTSVQVRHAPLVSGGGGGGRCHAPLVYGGKGCGTHH